MNPFDNETVAMVLTTQISADMQFAIDDDFKVTGHAEDVQSTFVKIDSYFKTSLTEAKMNGRVGVVHAFMIAAVNKALEDGVQIYNNTIENLSIKTPRIRMFEKYLFIDAQLLPDFPITTDPSHPLVRDIRKIESEINGNTVYAEKGKDLTKSIFESLIPQYPSSDGEFKFLSG